MYLADLNERAQNCLEVIIKQMKAAEMFREHESTLFLLIYSVNFSWHPCAKFQIFYLSDPIVN